MFSPLRKLFKLFIFYFKHLSYLVGGGHGRHYKQLVITEEFGAASRYYQLVSPCDANYVAPIGKFYIGDYFSVVYIVFGYNHLKNRRFSVYRHQLFYAVPHMAISTPRSRIVSTFFGLLTLAMVFFTSKSFLAI